MQEIAICPICKKQVTAPAGKIPMRCPDCHSNIKRAARLYVNEDGVLVRYDGHLPELSLPEAVRTVGENVFFCHTELEAVHFPHGLLAIANSAFGKCGLREVRLPDSLLTLGRNAFAGCSQLAAVTFSRKLTVIPDRAFEGCSQLAAADLSAVTAIGADAFAHCTSLCEVTLSRELAEIGYRAFFLCRSLPSITLPKRVKTVGANAFSQCGALQITCEATAAPSGWDPTFHGGCPVTFGYRG